MTPTPAFLSGDSHGQRSLVGYSPWGHIESDTTEPLIHSVAVLIIRSTVKVSVSQCFCEIDPYFTQ